MDISSDRLMEAMLAHQLDGNEMKLIIAYVKLGAWKDGAEIFLPEAKRVEWGISRATAKRARGSLKDKGWLKLTGNKSRYGCDKYTLHIPALPKVAQNEPGRWLNLDPEVAQFEPSGGSNPTLEVIKEVIKEVPKTSNEDTSPSAASAAGASSASLTSLKDRDDLPLNESSLIGPDPARSPIVAKVTEVAQNEPSHSVTQNDTPAREGVFRASWEDELDERLRKEAAWKQANPEAAARLQAKREAVEAFTW